MDNFSTLALQNPAHDINGGIVPVKKAGGCYNPNLMLWGI
jgi:hypothetical protein